MSPDWSLDKSRWPSSPHRATIPLALVTGKTLVIKPSERDPGATMIIAELWASVPAFNVVHGTVPTVNAIFTHPLIRAVSFLGGNGAGRQIYTPGTKNLNAQCNMGAKNHAVVMPDANKDQALNALLGAACGVTKILLDGRGVQLPGYPAGNWVGSTIIEVGSTELAAYKEEIFGPVLCVLSVPTLDAAIAVLNANPFGNGAALFTQLGPMARKCETEVQAGQIGVNVPIPAPLSMFSWTGNKVPLLSALPFFMPQSFVAEASILGDINSYGKG
ncbi:Aldehyde/histidinol dehydrogenase [Mycena galopus ATCC 62051]|nr:Aldehyde/histidinol dehydrogenase [Mycena galopus ATCC 62051]